MREVVENNVREGKRIIRSSRSQMFFKIDVLKKFAICTEKACVGVSFQ